MEMGSICKIITQALKLVRSQRGNLHNSMNRILVRRDATLIYGRRLEQPLVNALVDTRVQFELTPTIEMSVKDCFRERLLNEDLLLC